MIGSNTRLEQKIRTRHHLHFDEVILLVGLFLLAGLACKYIKVTGAYICSSCCTFLLSVSTILGFSALLCRWDSSSSSPKRTVAGLLPIQSTGANEGQAFHHIFPPLLLCIHYQVHASGFDHSLGQGLRKYGCEYIVASWIRFLCSLLFLDAFLASIKKYLLSIRVHDLFFAASYDRFASIV